MCILAMTPSRWRRRRGRGFDRDKSATIGARRARERRLPVVRRREMLAELMRLKQCVAIAGTHGKTTTTSLVATLLDAGGLDPTVINGGIINAYGTNARLAPGTGWLWRPTKATANLPEASSRCRHRHQYRPGTSRSLPHIRRDQGRFLQFIENLPFYGFAVMCLDHRRCRSWLAASPIAASILWRESSG